MTENDEPRLQCKRVTCYGIVREYTEDGPREPPDDVTGNKYVSKLKEIILKLVGQEPSPITWHECTVCHEHHTNVPEQ